MGKEFLDVQKVVETIQRLKLRIHDRFPDSGLHKTCSTLYKISLDTKHTMQWLAAGHIWIRLVTVGLVSAFAAVILWIAVSLKMNQRWNFQDFIQTGESATNLLIFMSLAFYFLWTLEQKWKRSRVIKKINQLRELAHIVDMHQLTKDPASILLRQNRTENSPNRSLSQFELSRYLDYSVEMFSLIGKLGYLYVTRLNDPVSTQAANDLESLTTGLSRKVWQKIVLVRNVEELSESSSDHTQNPDQAIGEENDPE